jgi:hypothetical protein
MALQHLMMQAAFSGMSPAALSVAGMTPSTKSQAKHFSSYPHMMREQVQRHQQVDEMNDAGCVLTGQGEEEEAEKKSEGRGRQNSKNILDTECSKDRPRRYGTTSTSGRDDDKISSLNGSPPPAQHPPFTSSASTDTPLAKHHHAPKGLSTPRASPHHSMQHIKESTAFKMPEHRSPKPIKPQSQAIHRTPGSGSATSIGSGLTAFGYPSLGVPVDSSASHLDLENQMANPFFPYLSTQAHQYLMNQQLDAAMMAALNPLTPVPSMRNNNMVLSLMLQHQQQTGEMAAAAAAAAAYAAATPTSALMGGGGLMHGSEAWQSHHHNLMMGPHQYPNCRMTPTHSTAPMSYFSSQSSPSPSKVQKRSHDPHGTSSLRPLGEVIAEVMGHQVSGH